MTESKTRTADRAVDLLTVVCEAGPVTLAVVAKRAGLPASTSLRLLRSLEVKGFVSRNPATGEFTPGPRMMQLGAISLSRDNLLYLARGPMATLAEQTGESCYLSVVGFDQSALYIHIVEGTHSIRHVSWVGRTIPLENSAAGHALTGRLGYGDVAVVKDSVEDDVTALAATIATQTAPIAALSLVVPSYRVTPRRLEDLRRLLSLTACGISEALGHDVSANTATAT